MSSSLTKTTSHYIDGAGGVLRIDLTMNHLLRAYFFDHETQTFTENQGGGHGILLFCIAHRSAVDIIAHNPYTTLLIALRVENKYNGATRSPWIKYAF